MMLEEKFETRVKLIRDGINISNVSNRFEYGNKKYNKQKIEREGDNLDVPKHVSLRNLRIKLHKENFSMI